MYAVDGNVEKERLLLIEANRSVLLFIDVQTKLVPAINEAEACLSRCRLLLAGARKLGVPTLATEHCPESVGLTVTTLRDQLDPSEIFEKRHFNGTSEAPLGQALAALGRKTVVVAGMEAHVCVLQTVLGLKTCGYEPVVVADAVSSRRPTSKELALARLRHHRVDIVETEMVLFEWLQVAGTADFKELLPLIKSGSAD